MLSLLSALATPESSGGASGSTGSMMTTFVTFGLIIVIFYFLIIRPQKKRDKETKDMLSSIKKGDKVVSIGGIHGTVMAVKETTVVVKVDDNTRMEFSKSAISSIANRKAEPASASKKKGKKETPADEKVEKVSAPEKDAATDATVVETAPETDK
jgi:preprotein translocase subunit YajC